MVGLGQRRTGVWSVKYLPEIRWSVCGLFVLFETLVGMTNIDLSRLMTQIIDKDLF